MILPGPVLVLRLLEVLLHLGAGKDPTGVLAPQRSDLNYRGLEPLLPTSEPATSGEPLDPI